MTVTPVALTLISFIAAVAALTGVYLVQCSLARLARVRVRAL